VIFGLIVGLCESRPQFPMMMPMMNPMMNPFAMNRLMNEAMLNSFGGGPSSYGNGPSQLGERVRDGYKGEYPGFSGVPNSGFGPGLGGRPTGYERPIGYERPSSFDRPTGFGNGPFGFGGGPMRTGPMRPPSYVDQGTMPGLGANFEKHLSKRPMQGSSITREADEDGKIKTHIKHFDTIPDKLTPMPSRPVVEKKPTTTTTEQPSTTSEQSSTVSPQSEAELSPTPAGKPVVPNNSNSNDGESDD